MKLDVFELVANQGLADEWILEKCQLNQINLIVGKNASGKSKIVSAIHILSKALSGATFSSSSITLEWCLVFDIDRPQSKTEYRLKVDKNLRIEEELKIEEKILLKRDNLGKGTIFAEELEKDINFQIPEQELAVVKRRDFIQHSFLEKIYEWSNSVRFYEFGTELGQFTIVRIPQKLESLKSIIDLKDYNYVIGIFALGETEIGHNFKAAIVKDMNKIDYNISEIGIKIPFPLTHNISVSDNQENLPQFLYVQENDLNSITEQDQMSQGMFRALSLLIQVNYFLQSGQSGCIIIDDIGEGLDYQRSAALIKILIEKIEQDETNSVQLIMTTNDEFIMNGVPLEYWSVIDRTSGHVKLHNIFNAKEKIEEFKFIGLNNFDFFTSEFHKQEFSDEEE